MKFRKLAAALACLLVFAETTAVVFPEMTESVVLSANAAETGTLGELTYTINDGYVAISDCDTSVTNVEIPSEIEGLPVTEIANSAFENCALMTSVSIPDSVTKIGYKAFKGCVMLKSLTIPDSVTEIVGYSYSSDYGAFQGCTNLETVTIGNGLHAIGKEAFKGCTSLTLLTLGENVNTIGASAFSGCASLGNFTIPGKVITLGNSAFYGCGISEVSIPESVSEIGESCFAECSKLETVTISGGAIGVSAFENCKGMSSLTLENVTSIHYKAFKG
ncbi:MAG: leucine-rich repeat domain-containing protein, partial [Oscillospiraceae bacterium]|nr:leucine-rich repeat domain-containing protein [Oscillospiraceae bacterium]